MLQYNESMQVFSTIAYSLVILITLVVQYFFKNKSEFVKRIPIYVVGILIVLLELGKQLRNITGYEYGTFFAMFRGITDEFSAYALPFHFCSFFIFWIIFEFAFFKNKKIRAFFENMSFLWSLFVFILIFFYPDMIYGGAVEDVYSGEEITHTTIFHFLVVLYFGLTLALRTYNFEIKKIYQSPLCMLIYGAIAIPAAHVFKENYCSIYSCEGWDFLQSVFDMGYVVYDGVLIIIGVVISLILYVSIWFVEKLRDKVKDNKLYLIGYLAMIPGMFILLLISKSSNYEKLQGLYPIYLTLVAFICCLPATIKGHILTKHK